MIFTKIDIADLEVVESDWTDEQWTDNVNNDLPWVEKMARSDSTLLPRYAEDILDGMADKSGVPIATLYRLQTKKDLRKTKP